MENNIFETAVKNMYKQSSNEILDLLTTKGILFESDYGFGSVIIEKYYCTLEELFNNDGYYINLDSGCYYPEPDSGDTLYYIFNKDMFEYDEAFKLAGKRYLKNKKRKKE